MYQKDYHSIICLERKAIMMKGRKIFIILMLAIVIIASSGCTASDLKDISYAKTVVLTVDDSSVYLNELMYHVKLAQMQGELYATFLNESDFWSKEYSEGVTMGDVMKQEAMDNAIKYELLNHMAIEEGYSLTEEELSDCKSKVESILKSLPEDDIRAMELTEEELLEIQKKIALSTRYYTKYYINQNIDDETAYEKMKEGHKIEINNKVWKLIKLGEIKK